MFLKNIGIRNYKSLKDVDVSFKDGMNIIIGKNGTGKSNLLEFIFFNLDYRSIIDRNKGQNLDYNFILNYKQDKKTKELSILLKDEKTIIDHKRDFNTIIDISKKNGNEFEYKNLKITRTDEPDEEERKKWQKVLPDVRILREFRVEYIEFYYPDDSYWFSKPEKCQIDFAIFLNFNERFNAFALTTYLVEMYDSAFITEMLVNESTAFGEHELQLAKGLLFNSWDRLNNELRINYYLSNSSIIQEIRLSKNVNAYLVEGKIFLENLIFEFRINNSWVPWSYLSDGTKRLFYLITESLCLEEGLLLIEEPELGIHPHQLFKLMDFLKEQSRTKQIIISTHSPMVLDILAANELDRITIAKIDKNGSHFSKLTKKEREKAALYMQETGHLSDYWLHSDLEGDE